MKKIALLLFVAVGIISFSNTVSAQGKLQNWKELKDFHKVMSQTFHPSEEGNLEPIKKRIGEMVESAKNLQASKIPGDFDTDKVKKSVAKLVTGSQKLEKTIKAGAKDDKITKSLSALHDTFHDIVGLCSEIEKEGHDHGHEHKEGEEHHHHHGEGGHKH